MDATTFRVRQVGWAIVGFGAALIIVVSSRPATPLTGLLLAGAPLLAFLIVEQQLATKSAARQKRLFHELPVVSEQLAMLFGAGYSLRAAINRLASRGTGVCAEDLRVVQQRIGQGVSETTALREWAATAQVPALDRLVAVLALNRETTDLGGLVSEEARAVRKDVQRQLTETMERRAQQVWIPVTVATLIPGVIFLSIPFIEALRQFAG
jgi:Flp pilus assembly protein TadB